MIRFVETSPNKPVGRGSTSAPTASPAVAEIRQQAAPLKPVVRKNRKAS